MISNDQIHLAKGTCLQCSQPSTTETTSHIHHTENKFIQNILFIFGG